MNSQYSMGMSARSGEKELPFNRSDRLYILNDQWFFHTREGFDVGPFHDKDQAKTALIYFVEKANWPTERQLSAFTHKLKKQ